MDITRGEMLYYGGIVGMAVIIVIAVIVVAVMLRSKKRLYRKLNEEYGLGLK